LHAKRLKGTGAASCSFLFLSLLHIRPRPNPPHRRRRRPPIRLARSCLPIRKTNRRKSRHHLWLQRQLLRANPKWRALRSLPLRRYRLPQKINPGRIRRFRFAADLRGGPSPHSGFLPIPRSIPLPALKRSLIPASRKSPSLIRSTPRMAVPPSQLCKALGCSIK